MDNEPVALTVGEVTALSLCVMLAAKWGEVLGLARKVGLKSDDPRLAAFTPPGVSLESVTAQLTSVTERAAGALLKLGPSYDPTEAEEQGLDPTQTLKAALAKAKSGFTGGPSGSPESGPAAWPFPQGAKK